ncbi:MAG: GtrA family protein [Hyphomicrobiaceae bacterium]
MISLRRDIIGEPGKPVPPIRHFGGFVVAGVSALSVDIATTKALIAFAGLNPFAARLIAYVPALLTSWLINRTITFRMAVPASLAELGKFIGVVWLSQTVNYSIYATVLLLRPPTDPAAAIIAASLAAMFVSYAGYRFGVFRRPQG